METTVDTLAICKKLGNKLRDTQNVEKISSQKKNFIPYINALPWDSKTLSHGLPALICVFSELDDFFPGEGWDIVAHKCIVELMETIQNEGIYNTSMFSGLAGICFSVYLSSKSGLRYKKLLSSLNMSLIKSIDKTIIKNSHINSPMLYDVIVGASGIVSYLLNFIEEKFIYDTVILLLKYIISIVNSIDVLGDKIPGWHAERDCIIHKEDREKYPQGYCDTGVAHGISGCLIALSVSSMAGINLSGQKKAMKNISSWLQRYRIDICDEKNVWHAKIKCQNGVLTMDDEEVVYKDGWCYGAPGISYGLLTASKALNDDDLRDYAIETMKEVCSRFASNNNLSCVSFCHGYAGLLTILHNTFVDTQEKIFLNTANDIESSIVEKFDDNLPFGFKFLASFSEEQDLWIDSMGLLDGASGTIMALLLNQRTTKRAWSKIFMLH